MKLPFRDRGKQNSSCLFVIACILAFASIACGITSLPVSDSKSIPATLIQSESIEQPDSVTVTAWAVNIRDLRGRVTGEYAMRGDVLYGSIEGNWFILETMGYAWGKVWLGCLSVKSDYGCQSK